MVVAKVTYKSKCGPWPDTRDILKSDSLQKIIDYTERVYPHGYTLTVLQGEKAKKFEEYAFEI